MRFIQRIQDHTNAFEVGYYKASTKHRDTGESHIFYGKFHVLLKKEHGIWKILMDADTAEHISEELFQSASPLVQRK